MMPVLLHISMTILTLFITLIWLSPLYKRLNLFWIRASDALCRLYDLQPEPRGIKIGRIREGDSGFWIVKQALSRSRPDLGKCEKGHGRIREIYITTEVGLRIGSVGRYQMPCDLAYVKFMDGYKECILKEESESKNISNWTGRIVEEYTGFVIVALMMIWTGISIYYVLIP